MSAARKVALVTGGGSGIGQAPVLRILDEGGRVVAADISEAPGDRLLVTMAVTAPEAEQIVFAAEFGSLWLTGQDARTDSSNSRVLTLQQAYVGVPR